MYVLLWLNHTLSPNKLQELLKDETFQSSLLQYLEDIIKEDLEDFEIQSKKYKK